MSKNKRAVVYIDGFNLYSGMMDKGWGKYRWLDLGKLAREITPGGFNLVSLKYFTSRIRGNQDKRQRQQNYINAARAHNALLFSEKYGRFQLFPSR